MVTTFQRAYPPTQPAPGLAYWFPFRGTELLVREQGQELSLALCNAADMAIFEPQAALYIGTLGGIPCMTCEVGSESALPQDWKLLGLRALFGCFEDAAYEAARYAWQILYWQRNSRYCPYCSHPMGELFESWGRKCPNCGYIGYPPVIPAILVLVHNGDQVLLAHQPGWGKRYSILAGFVEPGETLEECVKREVREEVNIEIDDVTYVASQPWPFPTQLMIGFTARYVSGEIHPDQQELDHAAWFRFDDLPELPAPLSLSYQIIKTWVDTQTAGAHT
ncbi:NAD(+) diphosphatase [Ktedonosporobacter rubrisoli]|uniref:NAD(+) diphosphatase n=1 Tax=Ktedonosporobacter rubrisoli TaxID=2509675 RepID=A0A4P6JR63_KTERU|nr:NAD(+) diphosphatase [Ktedonosporobacter rubrisoli]QBD77928.1 NAD(+) diphosphatase [Ktedonosporobacter rubrisoli]